MQYVKAMLSSAIALSALTGVQAMAAASTFDFSYTTVDQDQPGTHVITGSFEGVASGNLVTDISNVTMSIDGTSYGSFSALSYLGGNQYASSGATASFDGLQNNFLFDNGAPNRTYFYVIPWEFNQGQSLGEQAFVNGSTYIDLYNGQYQAANWSLTAEVSAVPEPANAALLGAALLTVGLVSRKRKQQR